MFSNPVPKSTNPSDYLVQAIEAHSSRQPFISTHGDVMMMHNKRRRPGAMPEHKG